MRTLLLTSLMFFVLLTSQAKAVTGESSQVAISKADARAQAVDICRLETQQRYGIDSIKFIANKSIWSKYMQGALVKMKIRPEDKNSKNYYCVVKLDSSVDFIRK